MQSDDSYRRIPAVTGRTSAILVPILQVWQVIKVEILKHPGDLGTEMTLAVWFMFFHPFAPT